MGAHSCCPRCTGGGEVTTERTCPECAGHSYFNADGVTIVCQHCHGTGKENVPCPECADHHKH